MTDPCKLPETRPILPDGNVVTIWPYHTLWPEARPLLELAKPAGVMLHGSAEWLVENVAQFAERFRRELSYEPSLMLGIAADGDKARAVERWAKVAAIALEIGAVVVQVNAEGKPENQWTDAHAAMITEAYAAMREAAPDVHMGHTSWYSADLFPQYPFGAFCGEGGADSTHPQVYLPGGSRAGLLARHEKSVESYAGMKRAGVIDKACEVQVYLEAAQQNDAAGTLTLAPLYRSVIWWGFVPETDEQGRRSMVGACLLRRLGYHGVDAIAGFQRDHGLHADGYPGPVTQRALGLP